LLSGARPIYSGIYQFMGYQFVLPAMIFTSPA
jgi:hypothetical protein